MAPKAIKDGRRQRAVKKAHMAKFKDEAKVHKVNKTPSQAQAENLSLQEMDDVTQEGQEKEHEEEQLEEQEGECQQDETTEKDKTKVSGKERCHFWKSLPEAPMAVQEVVQERMDLPTRSFVRKVLAAMASAYAMQKWDHKIFKSLQQEWPKVREDKVMPKVIMLAKRCGKSAFEQAPCLRSPNL